MSTAYAVKRSEMMSAPVAAGMPVRVSSRAVLSAVPDLVQAPPSFPPAVRRSYRAPRQMSFIEKIAPVVAVCAAVMGAFTLGLVATMALGFSPVSLF